jgi:hypothetical protein
MTEAAASFDAGHPLGPRLVVREAAVPPRPDSAQLHLGWRSAAPDPRAEPGLLPLPADFAKRNSLSLPLALENWAKGGGSTLRALPLFWNPWGVAGDRLTQAPSWEALLGRAGAARSLVLPGGTPYGRQALFAGLALGRGGEEALLRAQEGRLRFRDPAFASLLPAFIELERRPLFHTDTMRFSEADLDNLRSLPEASKLFFLRDYRSSKKGEIFKSLRFEAADGSYALISAAWVGYYSGPKGSSSRAFDFLAFLCAPERQGSLARALHLLPANIATPRLDPIHAELEAALLRARALVLVDPEPAAEKRVASWDAALSHILGDPERWQTLLPED